MRSCATPTIATYTCGRGARDARDGGAARSSACNVAESGTRAQVQPAELQLLVCQGRRGYVPGRPHGPARSSSAWLITRRSGAADVDRAVAELKQYLQGNWKEYFDWRTRRSSSLNTTNGLATDCERSDSKQSKLSSKISARDARSTVRARARGSTNFVVTSPLDAPRTQRPLLRPNG